MSTSYEITEKLEARNISYNISEKTRVLMLVKEAIGEISKDSRFPYGLGPKLQKEIKATCASYINQAYYKLKKYSHGKHAKDFFGFREFSSVCRSDLNKFLLSKGYNRGAPRWERDACNKMIYQLKKLPDGGVVLIFGSPAPLSASKKNYNMICDDNLEVFHAAKFTSNKGGIIVIGDLVNEEKAAMKCQDLRELNSIANYFRILIGPATAPILESMIRKLAKNYSLVKVIIMTSGIWKHSDTNKFLRPNLANYDLNFERASIKITNEFDNVHIIAMARGIEVGHGFSVVHVHKGEQSFVPKPNLPEI